MTKRNPKVPNREFTLKCKGKKVNIVVSTHDSSVGDLWGAQLLCPWGCGGKFITTNKATPRRVADRLQRDLENHWRVRHQNVNP